MKNLCFMCLYMLVMIFTSTLSQANTEEVSCERMSYSVSEKGKSLYHLSATLKCIVRTDKPYQPLLMLESYDRYLHSDLNLNLTKRKEKEDGSLSYKGRKKITTVHGKMDIKGDLHLNLTDKDSFIYEFKSRSISADGNAENTKSMREQVKINSYHDKMEIILTNEASVKKPWYAPEVLFLPAAKDGMIEDTEELRKEHLGVVELFK